MAEWRNGCGAFVRRLAVLAPLLAPLAAGAAEPDPRLAQNPALGRVAATDPAEARRLLDAIDQLLRQPKPPQMRGSLDYDGADEALLAGNPLLGQTFAHDPAAAVELLKRIKASGDKGGK